MKNITHGIIRSSAILGIVLYAQIASAHVIVSPAQASGASYQTFTMSVPSEKDATTVSVRLALPSGLDDVMPNVKPGWNISVQKSSDGSATGITWSGGRIPAGFRDQFNFSVKTPNTGTLQWKAYQTYDDGSVISWAVNPASIDGTIDHDTATSGPYSQTVLIPKSGANSGSMAGMDMGSGDIGGMNMAAMTPAQTQQHIMLFLTLLALGISLGCVWQITKIEKHMKK